MRIDSHQHYWKIDRGDYGWITPEIPTLYRDFSPCDLLPHLQAHQFDGSIVVQAAPTIEETEYILSLADQHTSIIGVVGWLDLFDSNHRTHYERFRKNPKFLGFRIMIQEMPNANLVLQPSFVQALREYAELEVPIDILVLSHQLPAVCQLLKHVPNIRAVIDHMAKPSIKQGVIEPWLTYMQEIAQYQGIYCKLSGMVTEADRNHWKHIDFIVYIRYMLKLFGSRRVIFGSDWPVCLLAARYDQVVNLMQSSIPKHWSEEEIQHLFGINAKEFYKC